MRNLTRGLAAGALALSLIGIGSLASAEPAHAQKFYGATGKGCTGSLFKQGASSTCVTYIQRMLNGINAEYRFSRDPFLATDGIFGPKTDAQMRAFQKWYPSLVVDGIIGPKTWDALCLYAGQSSFNYVHAPEKQRVAWTSAYSAGCYVEQSNGKRISRY